jgi:hypothetical protein
MAKTQEVRPESVAAPSMPPSAEMQRVELDLPSTSTPQTEAETEGSDEAAALEWRNLTVESGDSCARRLSEHDVDYPVIHALASAGDAGKRLGQLRPGDQIRLGFTPDGNDLQKLVYQRSVDRHVVFERNGEGPSFSSRVVEAQLERRLQHAHARIETSLFQAAAAADWLDHMRRRRQLECVGPLTAAALTMAFHRGHFKTSDAFIAFLGLDVRVRDSGCYRGRRKLTKAGDPELRRLLYLAAMQAKSKPAWQTYYQRHLERGLAPIQAINVLARKLARVAYALMKNQADYQPRIPCAAT